MMARGPREKDWVVGQPDELGGLLLAERRRCGRASIMKLKTQSNIKMDSEKVYHYIRFVFIEDLNR